MSEYVIWIHIVLILLFSIGACCFIAAFSQQIRTMFSGLFMIFYRPLTRIQEKATSYINSIKNWLLRQLENESESDEEGPVYYIIGSLIYSVLAVIFILCDYGMILLTLEAFGIDDAGFQLPLDTSTLTTAALVTSSCFWGAILFDLLGVTRIAPWRKTLSAVVRRIFMGIAILMILISIFIAGAMAYWRANVTTQFVPEAEAAELTSIDQEMLRTYDSNQTVLGGTLQIERLTETGQPLLDTSADWVIYASLIGIAVLSFFAAAPSAVGLIILFKFFILALIGIGTLPLLPVIFISWLIAQVIERVFNFLETIIDFFANVGSSILTRFGWQPQGTENHEAGNRYKTEESAEDIGTQTSQTAAEAAGWNPALIHFSGGKNNE